MKGDPTEVPESYDGVNVDEEAVNGADTLREG